MTWANTMKRKYEILVKLDEIIELDYEGFLDLVSNLCVGNELLTDITYEVIGSKDGLIKLSVIGDDYLAAQWNLEYIQNIDRYDK